MENVKHFAAAAGGDDSGINATSRAVCTHSDGSEDSVRLQVRLIGRLDGLKAYVRSKIPAYLRGWISAEDVVQDVCISAFATASTFRDHAPDAFDRWLKTITQRRLLDAMKRGERVKRGGGVADIQMGAGACATSDVLNRLAAPGITPSATARLNEQAEVLQSALDGLPEARRQALKMYYVEGLSREKIAGLMRLSDSAVGGLLFHGLRQLRERLRRDFLSRFGRARDDQDGDQNRSDAR